jgi:histidinol-phosphate phosphatase family protein
MQCVILAGGKGTRLSSRLNGRPKPLIEIDGVPLLERQLRQLAESGVRDALILVNHEAGQIDAFLRERDWGDLAVALIDDGEPRGTAGAVLACLDRLQDRFLVVYGDTLFDIDIHALCTAHARAGCDGLLFLHPNDHPFDSDLVEVDECGRILAFHNHPHPPGAFVPNLVNAAFYCLERRPLERYRAATPPIDFAKDLFPRMLADGARLMGYRSFEYVKDVGTPARVDKAEAQLRSGAVRRARRDHPQAAVFLDRDGTLNALRDYVRRTDDLHLLPGAADAVRRLNQHELRAVLVTNQPVLARGECSWAELCAIHAKLETELGESGAFLDALYICPHHPDAGFPGEVADLKVDCECRKPKPGLIHSAAAEMNIELGRSWLVGDSTSDMEAAQRACVRSVLVLTGEKGRDGRCFAEPDFVAQDIGGAVTLITEQYPRIAGLLKGVVADLRVGDLLVVTGYAQAGKSTLSAALVAEARAMDLTARRLCLDRWIRPEGQRGPGFLGRHDLAAAERSLQPWLEGGAASLTVPIYDRWSRRGAGESRLKIGADEILVLEGVAAQGLRLQTRRRVVRLFIETKEAERRQRVIADLMARGATPPEARSIYERRRQDENPLIDAARAAADLTLSLDPIFTNVLETAS